MMGLKLVNVVRIIGKSLAYSSVVIIGWKSAYSNVVIIVGWKLVSNTSGHTSLISVVIGMGVSTYSSHSYSNGRVDVRSVSYLISGHARVMIGSN